MPERRNGWTRWDDFLFAVADGEIKLAFYLAEDHLQPAEMIRVRGSSKCCIANLRDGYWAVKVKDQIYDVDSRRFRPPQEVG